MVCQKQGKDWGEMADNHHAHVGITVGMGVMASSLYLL